MVHLSNGEAFTGELFLTPGRHFKLNVPEAGTLKTTDMVTGQDVRYGKVRTFTFDAVREIAFHPKREGLARAWRFIETTDYNEATAQADYTPAKKEYRGKPYPLRTLTATVTFESAQALRGHLYTTTIYLRAEDRLRRWVLRSKQRGKAGQSFDDLVYVQRIRLLDKQTDMAAEVTAKWVGIDLGPHGTVQAVTRASLTPVPTRISTENACVVSATFGEDFYLAFQKDNTCIVPWPTEQDPAWMSLVRNHLERIRDFYNDRQLLGALLSEDGRALLTLVNLRRRHAPTHFGRIGGEWDREKDTIVEPWRLSLWRWKVDPEHRQLALVGRGTFFRKILLPEDPTPEVKLSARLWQQRREGTVVFLGQE